MPRRGDRRRCGKCPEPFTPGRWDFSRKNLPGGCCSFINKLAEDEFGQSCGDWILLWKRELYSFSQAKISSRTGFRLKNSGLKLLNLGICRMFIRVTVESDTALICDKAWFCQCPAPSRRFVCRRRFAARWT